MTTCSFGPLTVQYDARVLVPRPWTLQQSEWAAELAGRASAGPMLELCAGAGHIGQAAAVLAGRDLVQVERDPVAAGYARRNAADAGLNERVEVRQASLADALAPDEVFPLVLADPPYLPSAQVSRWPEDPVTAIDGGPDGLDVVRLCLRVAAAHLVPGGPLLLQVAGDAQVDVMADVVTRDELPLAVTDVRRHDPERAVVLLRRA